MNKLTDIITQVKALPKGYQVAVVPIVDGQPDYMENGWAEDDLTTADLLTLVDAVEQMEAMVNDAKQIAVGEHGSLLLANVNATVGNMMRKLGHIEGDELPPEYKWFWNVGPHDGRPASGMQGPFDTVLEAYNALKCEDQNDKTR